MWKTLLAVSFICRKQANGAGGTITRNGCGNQYASSVTYPAIVGPCHNIPYWNVLRRDVPCRSTPCPIIPYRIIPCRNIPCHTLQYHTLSE